MTEDGGVWYINSIDPIHDNTKLPTQIFCSKRPESEFGRYLHTRDLYVPDDVDFVKESDQFVAKEIYNQLGGGKFAYITGAKHFVSDKDSLRFRIPRSKNGINYVKITLNSMDTYDIEYGKIYGDKYTIVKTENNIYNDMLVNSFETNTGLYTKL